MPFGELISVISGVDIWFLFGLCDYNFCSLWGFDKSTSLRVFKLHSTTYGGIKIGQITSYIEQPITITFFFFGSYQLMSKIWINRRKWKFFTIGRFNNNNNNRDNKHNWNFVFLGTLVWDFKFSQLNKN